MGRLLICFWSLLFLVSSFVVSGADPQCVCPQSALGWRIYPDSAKGPPDFVSKGRVKIKELLICEHGIHFIFDARQEGKAQHACLAMVKPEFSAYMAKLAAKEEMEDEAVTAVIDSLDRDVASYNANVMRIENTLGRDIREGEKIEFEGGWFKKQPELYVGAPLVIHWREKKAELVGAVEVLFRDK